MGEVSIFGCVATCLFALLQNVRFGGRRDGGVDPLDGEFVENGDWRGTRGGDGVDEWVSHCRVNDVPPKGKWCL